MGNNQSNHFPHIPEKVTWSLNTIINGKSQTLLSDFFEGRGGCTQARRAQLVCDSPDSLQDETDYLYNVFSKNNYNTDFVRRNTHGNTDTQTNVNSGPVTTATVPYIRGTSETIARILKPYNIRVAHKPITTLRRLLTNVKDKDKPEDRQGAVYKIKCCDCQASYIRELKMETFSGRRQL